jgi:hypothetical protein
MSHTIGNAIADSLEHSLRYVGRLVVGVAPEQFARLAAPGGVMIQSNHGAFILGHLSIYGPRIMEHLGGDVAAVAPSQRFVEAFSKDAKCLDDPEAKLYPPMVEITETFLATYRAALQSLRSAEADDSLMAQANPSGGRLTELFPTIGSMLTFYAGGHVSMHLGQMSAWRRMLGLSEA